MILVALATAVQATTITVGPGGAYPTITDGLAAARAWDTVRVAPGVYSEHPVVNRPVVLLGETGAVIDGGGRGVVLTINASATVRGFTIRGSGANQSEEHAGILATEAPGLVVENNRLEDVLFGIYLKQSDEPVIRRNEIEGKDLALSRRGDGIRLWYSHRGVITGNRVRRSRDVVIWFSDQTEVRENSVSESRYGLHYMYSDDNVFEANEFVANSVGAFIMYSSNITFRDNVFANARGTTGRGLGFKDSDRITAEGNLLVKNAIGISIDNSPTSEGVTNTFRGNVIAYNDIGVSLLPSVHSNLFTENDFLDNVQPIAVTGGGTALANQWRGNFWTEYAGFDADDDGRGDSPFVFERLSDDFLARHEPLRVYNLSLAVATLNTLSRVLPLLAPEPVVVDSAPRLRPVAAAEPTPRTASAGITSLVFLAMAGAALATALRLRRPLGRRS